MFRPQLSLVVQRYLVMEDSDDKEMICDISETSPPNGTTSSGLPGSSSCSGTEMTSLLPKPGTKSFIWRYFHLREGGKAVDDGKVVIVSLTWKIIIVIHSVFDVEMILLQRINICIVFNLEFETR